MDDIEERSISSPSESAYQILRSGKKLIKPALNPLQKTEIARRKKQRVSSASSKEAISPRLERESSESSSSMSSSSNESSGEEEGEVHDYVEEKTNIPRVSESQRKMNEMLDEQNKESEAMWAFLYGTSGFQYKGSKSQTNDDAAQASGAREKNGERVAALTKQPPPVIPSAKEKGEQGKVASAEGVAQPPRKFFGNRTEEEKAAAKAAHLADKARGKKPKVILRPREPSYVEVLGQVTDGYARRAQRLLEGKNGTSSESESHYPSRSKRAKGPEIPSNQSHESGNRVRQ